MPIWYWTDAEISGGNSGGLAVNEAGEWIGLPTWVVSEERTAGRLGGLLPLGAAQANLAIDGYVPGEEFVPAVPVQPAGGDTLTLNNDSSAAICYVYISPTTAADWGDDRLDNREVVNRGDSRDFRVAPGNYDMLLVDCDGETLQDSREIAVSAGTTLTFTGTELLTDTGALASFTLENNSARSICYVYISPADSPNWGSDQLGDREIVRAGTVRTWELPAGIYDVLLQDCDGKTMEDMRSINLLEGEVVTFQ